MSLSGSFNPVTGVVTVNGDGARNTITLSRDAAGGIRINGGAVSIAGGKPTVANTSLIQVLGQAGNDIISIDETNGAMPQAQLFGGDGDDTLTGGSGGDLLFGQAGDDTILGEGGDDQLFGGDGDDVLTGGAGNDQVFGQAGNDQMIWNPGDGNDLLEGGDGTDTAEVNGGNGAEVFTISANGTRVRFDQTNAARFTLDIGTTENLVVNANGGDDIITAGNGLAALIGLTLDGGAGNDTITGGDGDDLLIGGDGNDVITGGRGADTAQLGAGDDTFIWNPGDGSDVVEGGTGSDTLIFNGSNVAEQISISANGGRTKLFRDVGNVTMDLNGMETIQLAALGGADTITVGDLTGTGVKLVAIDLASPPGSDTGDGQADTVIINGTAGGTHVTVTSNANSIVVAGLAAEVTIAGMESANDSLIIDALGGNDTIDASAVTGNPIRLTIDGGDGNDTITGGDGGDTLIGGAGNDVITGGRGNDIALLGDGNDTFIWNPGDGSDTVEGQGGTDKLVFNGSNANETMDVSANGTRARLFRDVGDVTMDLNGIETIQIAAAGGADTISVEDLTGTGVTLVAVDLAAPQTTAGDGQPDRVIVNATAGDDAITIARSGGVLTVSGVAARVTVANAEGANDSLVVNGLGGSDTINASSLAAGQIALTINGGDGDDTITGSQGDDTIIGGRGADTAFMGKGNDTFVWNPGDGSDTVEGQTGTDTLVFNGSNVNENMDISANGSRVRLFRDVGNVTMDLNSVEQFQLAALGGADTITVNDLTGTGVTRVAIDLSGVPGSGTGDGQSDTVVINGTAGNDVISVTNNNGVVTVSGLATDVTIAGFEPTDHIVINGLGGDDVILGSGLGTAMLLTENGGDGADVLIGSDGNDTLTGGAGDDVLIGGAGQDVLDGGSGDNILIQDLKAGSSEPVGATADSDVITVSVSNGTITERSAAGAVTVPRQGGSNGPVVVNGLAGDDIIDASGVAAGQANLMFIGGAGNDIILASQGDDSMSGGTGDDTFVFSGGHHVIEDFQVHGSGMHGDIVALVGFADHTFDQAVADGHIARSAGGVVVSDGTNEVVTLRNVSLSLLTARDFRFG